MPLPRVSIARRLFSVPAPASTPARPLPFWQRPMQPTIAWRPLPRRVKTPAPRTYTTGPPSSSSSASSSAISRAERILSRLPRSMQKYTRRLKDAPLSHVVAFLVLHELTAIVPLFGLFGLFHWAASSGSKLVPLDYMLDHYGDQVASGVRRFEKYFRRKGWFGFGGQEEQGVEIGRTEETEETEETDERPGAGGDDSGAAVLQRWTSADAKYKIVVEVGLAYAITKVLLPVRIVASLWATPWFAGVLTRMRALRPRK